MARQKSAAETISMILDLMDVLNDIGSGNSITMVCTTCNIIFGSNDNPIGNHMSAKKCGELYGDPCQAPELHHDPAPQLVLRADARSFFTKWQEYTKE